MKIVLDTNVLISAILFGGKPRQVLETAITGSVNLVLSEFILEELRDVLARPKFHFPRDIIQRISYELRDLAVVVDPPRHLQVVKTDADDNRILECALSAEADVIVSGDPDLLDLKEFRGIPIWSPSQFLREFESL